MLRDYQVDIKNKIYLAWEEGHKNILVQLATGAGKTILFTDIIKEHRGGAIAIAHRQEIVSQISLSLARAEVKHKIIAPKNIVRSIIALHMFELNRSYIVSSSPVLVAGIDTLIRMDANDSIFKHTSLVVQDEAHHVLKKNKWGCAAQMFDNARGLYPTATPIRADGRGLGSHADGVIDILIQGISMRHLIELKYLTDYRIFAPKSHIDLSRVNITNSGEYSAPKLRDAVHKSQIVGDVVKHYLRISPGKTGVTFAVDIKSADEIAQAYRQAQIPAELITSKTPDLLRAQIMKRFKNREILQIVNVDLLGEGVDVPAIEVVSFARPTLSYALYAQQFGRALRPMPDKKEAIIIDHVNNVITHGLPDANRKWSLDSRDRKSKSKNKIQLKTCLNPNCLSVYEKIHTYCPFCGHYTEPADRSTPELVDGDLFELDAIVLNQLRGEITRIDNPVQVPQHLDVIAQFAVAKRHRERQQAQFELRETIAHYAGILKKIGKSDRQIYKQFYFDFGIDVMSAQILNHKDSLDLRNRINTLLECS